MEKEDEPSPVAVPEGSPEDTPEDDKAVTKPSSSLSRPVRAPIYLAVGFLLVTAIILAITLPLTLGKNKSSNGDFATATSTSSSSSSNNNNPGSNNNDGVNASPGGGVIEEFEKKGNTANSMNRELPLFSQAVTEGYANSDEFEAALESAFRREVSTYITQNFRGNNGGDGDVSEEAGREETVPAPSTADAGAMNMMADDAAMGSPAAAPAEGGVTDFETNNQEENVDEADIIKADANFVYAAYGDYIVVWNTAGKKVAQIGMPPIDLPDGWGEPPAVSASKTEEARSSYGVWIPKPSIQSMLLTDNHLIAVVSGYNDIYYSGKEDVEQESLARVLSNYKGSQIRLYQKTTSGDLNFVGLKDVNGHYVDARSIGDVVHLATASGVDMWTHLWHPLDRWNFAKNLTDAEYQVEAAALADKLVPEMARRLSRELADDTTDELPNFLQLNQWMTSEFGVNGTDSSNSNGPGFSMPFQAYDIASNLGQVTSFNVNGPLKSAGELTTSASAYMAPSYFDTLYGTEDHLVLATSGWDWDPTIGDTAPTTYVVALEINPNAPSTSFLSVGTLKGHLLNSYALDIVGNELRAATTVERNQWWWGPRPMPMDDIMMVEDMAVRQGSDAVDPDGLCPLVDAPCMDDSNRAACLEFVAAGCISILQLESCPLQFDCERYQEDQGITEDTSVTTLTEDSDLGGKCGGPPTDDDLCSTQESYEECLALANEGCEVIVQTLSCPPSFSCAPTGGGDQGGDANGPSLSTRPPEVPPDDDDESRTENYMSVLTMTRGQMTKKGQVQIGEKNERITAVRFFDDIAYAVTFERTDPFYVLDMSVPKVLGELKLPGFSSYLHSMNADNTLLLAIGQNATDDGTVTGLMVTVFDSTDAANPVALVSHTFENDDNAWSSSSIEWDYKAFRYVDGKLIMPVDIYYNQEWNMETQNYDPLPDGLENFQGFAVMDISTTSIAERYRVSHMREPGSCNYCGGYLPTRSFVYNGDLMTVRENTVVSTNFNSGAEVWRLSLNVDGAAEVDQCCF